MCRTNILTKKRLGLGLTQRSLGQMGAGFESSECVGTEGSGELPESLVKKCVYQSGEAGPGKLYR